MNRRTFVSGTVAVAAVSPVKTAACTKGGIALNEDNSHYFFTRAGQKLDAAKVDSWVDQYAGTQVRELIISVNSMRTSYASKVWDPIWRGYDPNGPDDQPLLASLPPEGRKTARNWIHTAWQLAQDGIDVYARWIARARKLGLSPWLSTRMNDLHNVDDERAYIHSEFWRENPQFRRVPYRGDRWIDKALDFGRPEVRAHHMLLVRELAERYDFDGLELDWMRFGFHFRPGYEAEGSDAITAFTRDVRALLKQWEKKRGHRILLGARVPSRPHTAVGLGMDGVRWAKEGLIDMLVPCPFWATIEFDIPIEEWKRELGGTNVILAPGLEVLVRPYPNYRKPILNCIETVRGAASAMLDRGADRVYLFNYMDSETAQSDMENYSRLLREVGQLATMAGKPRRHVLTYSDTWAPGEPVGRNGLPAEAAPGRWHEFRLAVGPKPLPGPASVVLGVEKATPDELRRWALRINGHLTEFAGETKPALAVPKDCPLYAWRVSEGAVHRGYNVVEIRTESKGTIHWVEISIGA
jgi:uncharacterized lipoprotein YddW (UPF0748 family)